MTIGPGSLINGKYRLGRQLGEGGMGAIYEARHEFLGTEVALKFLHPALSSRPNVVARFVQEARVSANIKSPHVVSVVDVDQSPEGLAFLVMELLRGEPLASRLAREPVLSTLLSCSIALQCLLALDVAHALGVVHRDMKPENVFLTDAPDVAGATRDGLLVKILDFGIAKLRTLGEVKAQLTRPGIVMGTPEYMAPEQVFAAEAVDARADIYALGAMLFEMLAGRRPVQGDDARAIAAAVMSGQTPRLDAISPRVPSQIADVVAIALAPKPGDRFSSAQAMLRALVNAAKDAEIPIEAPPPERLRKATGVGKSSVLGAAGLGLAPPVMFGPGDPAAIAAFDARARGELPKKLAADGRLQGEADDASRADARAQRSGAPPPVVEGAPAAAAGNASSQGRIETGTVAQAPELPMQEGGQTLAAAPSPYAPPYAGSANDSDSSTSSRANNGRLDSGPGGTDAGMISPYATEGAWRPANVTAMSPRGPLSSASSSMDTTSSPELSSRRERRPPWLAILLGAAAVLGVVALIIFLLPPSSPPAPTPAPAATQGDDDEEPTPKKKPVKEPTTASTPAVATTTEPPAPTPPPWKPSPPRPSASAKPSASTSTSASIPKPPPSASTAKPSDTIEIPLPWPIP